MQRYAWVGLAACWAADEPALATVVHPLRPGIMCVSSQALAILTLPDGDSRTHRSKPDQKDLQIASAGNCIDLLPAMELTVYRSYHNTSLVFLDEDGRAGSTVYRAPNVDLQPPLAVSPDTSDTKSFKRSSIGDEGGYIVGQRFILAGGDGTIELLQDRRISPTIFNQFWRASDGNKVFEAQLESSSAARPLLAAQLRLVFDSKLQTQTRDLGYPLATLSPLGESGAVFILRVDETHQQAGRVVEEELVPAAHGLTPLNRPNLGFEVEHSAGAKPFAELQAKTQ